MAQGPINFAGIPKDAQTPNAGVNFSGIEKAPSAPATPKWSEPGGDVMLDMVRGALKQPGRLMQRMPVGILPGIASGVSVADATDQLYGLPPGASVAEMQPANDTEKTGGYVADVLQLLASAGATSPLPRAAIGRTIEDQGIKLQTALDGLARRSAKTGGAWGYVMRGHPLQGIYAGIARSGAKVGAKTVEGVGRLISSDPNAAAQLAVIGEKATTGAATLTTAQGEFILSAMDQLAAGRILSGAQRAWIASIFRSLPK